MAGTGASITAPSVVTAGQATNVNGTCPGAATTAVLGLTQGGASLFSASYAVTAGEWAGAVTATGQIGDATLTLACRADGSTLATATATTLLFAVPEGGRANVTVSPGTEPLGGRVTVTAACPTGSAGGGVYLFQGDNDPFAGTASSPVRSTGTIRVSFPVALSRPPGSTAPAPTRGPATAVVFCTDGAGMPTGTGHRDFTISKAVVAAPAPAATQDGAASRSTPARPTAGPTSDPSAPAPASATATATPAPSAAGEADPTPEDRVLAGAPVLPRALDGADDTAPAGNRVPLAVLGLALVAAGAGLVALTRRPALVGVLATHLARPASAARRLLPRRTA